jgi:light-independent protochlorophyllide reductase subunit B
LGAGAPALGSAPQPDMASEIIWTGEAQAELAKIPFFVRGKARRNTENFAAARGITPIQIETLYDARSHFSR